jgi:glycosyltransferase involved in cell wall biosynthesis
MKRFDKVEFESIGNPHKPRLICVTARKPLSNKLVEKNKPPKVSVIMPTYNRAHMIGRSIEGILNQTFKDWELIIVSDGSTDNTREVVLSYHDPRIRYFHKGHGGVASARNYAIRQAKGEYIAYCDDDDILLPFHLKTLANYLDRHPEVGFVKGDYVHIEAGSQKGYLSCGILLASMHRRNAFKKVGFFNEKLQVAEDTDMILRLFDQFTSKILDIVFVHRCLHKDNTVRREPKEIDDLADRLYAKRFPMVYKRRNPRRGDLLFLGFFISKRYPKTILKIAQIFHRLPTDADNDRLKADYFLGAGYYLSGDDSKAVPCLKKVIALSLASRRKLNADEDRILEFTYALLGRIYTQKREYEKALQYLCQGRNLNPKSNIVNLPLSDYQQKTIVKKRASQYHFRKYDIDKKVNWLHPLITLNLIRNSSQKDVDNIKEFLLAFFGDIKSHRPILSN